MSHIVRATDAQAYLRAALRGTIQHRAGDNSFISKDEQAQESRPLIAQALRTVRSGLPPGGRVSVERSVDAIMDRFERVNAPINPPGTRTAAFWSQVEVAKMMLSDPPLGTWLSHVYEMLATQGRNATPRAPTLAMAELDRRAVAFVRDHTSEGDDIDAGKLFPGLEAGVGLSAYVLADQTAQRIAEMNEVWMGGLFDAFGYDADAHTMLMVLDTPIHSDPRFFINLIDKRSGEVVHTGEVVVQDIPSTSTSTTSPAPWRARSPTSQTTQPIRPSTARWSSCGICSRAHAGSISRRATTGRACVPEAPPTRPSTT